MKELTVNPVIRHKIIWGWLRLLLGWLQMSLAAAGLGALLTVEVNWVTLVFVIGASIATIASRLLYRGRAAPAIEESGAQAQRDSALKNR